MSAYHRLNVEGAGLALSRRDFVAEKDWYGGYDYQKIQEPLGFDGTLWCFRPLPGTADEHNGLVLLRRSGRRDFTPRDRTLVREAHAVVAPLIGGPLARFADPSPGDLPPRVRQVLGCLLEGDGDKQVALRLGLSPFTVNQHTKRIYRHFGVAGRNGLAALWIRRGWGLPPS